MRFQVCLHNNLIQRKAQKAELLNSIFCASVKFINNQNHLYLMLQTVKNPHPYLP